jgi:hypothetical protein
MQLEHPSTPPGRSTLENLSSGSKRPTLTRNRLQAAACMLLAAGMPAMAQSESNGKWQFVGSTLFYGEQGRARVIEPTARITRIFPGGQSFSVGIGIDAITGASPSGAVPSNAIQTTTTPSGRVQTLPAGQVPKTPFKDHRGSLDLEWVRPLGLLTATTGGHFSREKDYQSVGANEKFTIELMDRLTTFSVGGGINRDSVFPTTTGSGGGFGNEGGDDRENGEGRGHGHDQARVSGLADGEPIGNSSTGANPAALPPVTGRFSKGVENGMVGVSRIVTRRWMLALDGSRTIEHGYLNEPYKVVSVLDGSGSAVSLVRDNRPSRRTRTSVLASSVYHLTDDVFYTSYRNYWDDWGVRSHTIDLKYRHELPEARFVQPHLRYYRQTGATFYSSGLAQGASLPEFVSSDGRLGPLQTMTFGATFGFHPRSYPGEFTIRAEYIKQWGSKGIGNQAGVQNAFDPNPPLSIGSILFAYSVRF